MWLEAAAFGACVDKGRLLDFLMSAPDLTCMKLNLVPEKTFGVMPLEYIVSDFHWSSCNSLIFPVSQSRKSTCWFSAADTRLRSNTLAWDMYS